MKLRVGTRRSKLARTQSGQTCALIEAARSGVNCELVPIETTGDQVRDRPLREAGGKGLFVKELDEALLDGRVDCAVHSLKDVPTVLPEGIVIAAIPEREDPRDLLITRDGRGPRELERGAVLGTTSARRAAQLLALDGSLGVTLLRGNVETRLRRLIEGDFDATFLAAAGIRRLGIDLAPARSVALDPFDFVPAPGQGALCVTARADDRRTIELLAAIDDRATHQAAEAERALARVLGGSCFLPVGAFARIENGGIRLIGVLASEDGRKLVRKEGRDKRDSAVGLGETLGREILRDGGEEIIAELPVVP